MEINVNVYAIMVARINSTATRATENITRLQGDIATFNSRLASRPQIIATIMENVSDPDVRTEMLASEDEAYHLALKGKAAAQRAIDQLNKCLEELAPLAEQLKELDPNDDDMLVNIESIAQRYSDEDEDALP